MYKICTDEVRVKNISISSLFLEFGALFVIGKIYNLVF
jgi:hypothetical protein